MYENVFNNDSNQNPKRIAHLIAGFLRNTLSEKEHDELDQWILESDDNMLLFEQLTDETNLVANLEWMDRIQTEGMLQKTKETISFVTTRKKGLGKKWLFGIAASVLIIVSVFGLMKLTENDKPPSQQPAADVMPGGNRAKLTLQNGTVIDLDSVNNGGLFDESGLAIRKTQEGEIVYEVTSRSGEAIQGYNTLSTPKGGKYKVVLPDGSQVWLNAGTTMKYPAVFNGHSREVELEGEAYFDIAKEAGRPFIVKVADGSDVTVFGTEFNVMAYKDEPAKLVTLVEGKIRIEKNKNQLVLKPGQQVAVKPDGLKIVADPDIEEAVGWKNGEFIFHDADIRTIMKQVERWYDVEVIYEGNNQQYFNASISRDEPVSRLLELLEKTDKIHFKIENHTIYVLP